MGKENTRISCPKCNTLAEKVRVWVIKIYPDGRTQTGILWRCLNAACQKTFVRYELLKGDKKR